MGDDRKVEILQRSLRYQGYFKVEALRLRHSLFAGGMGPPISRELVQRGHAVAVLPYDPVGDEIVMIEQFRIGPWAAGDAAWTMEVVAGIIEAGEDPIDVARRETREETGLEVADLVEMMAIYTTPGALSEHVRIYCGRVDASGAGGVHGLAAEGEDILVHVLPYRDVLAGLENGRFNVGPAVLALQWLALHRERLRERWLP